jgi:hypothetical protein
MYGSDSSDAKTFGHFEALRPRLRGCEREAPGGTAPAVHFLVVVPARNPVIVHRCDNDPPSKDVKTVVDSAYTRINNAAFAELLQFSLDSEKL